MALHRKRTASARRAHSADLHALERHQAEVERAAWLQLQTAPGAGNPLASDAGGSEPSGVVQLPPDAPGIEHPFDPRNESPEIPKGGRIDPGSILGAQRSRADLAVEDEAVRLEQA